MVVFIFLLLIRLFVALSFSSPGIAAAQVGGSSGWGECLEYVRRHTAPDGSRGDRSALHTAAVEQTALSLVRGGVVRPDTMALLNRAIHWVNIENSRKKRKKKQ